MSQFNFLGTDMKYSEFDAFLVWLGPWGTAAVCLAFVGWVLFFAHFIMNILPDWINKK